MSGASIEARHVSRRFVVGGEDVWAVRDVSISVAPGELLALIGRSGSGKTTLLNMIAGLDRPTEGEVEIDGRRQAIESERLRPRRPFSDLAPRSVRQMCLYEHGVSIPSRARVSLSSACSRHCRRNACGL